MPDSSKAVFKSVSGGAPPRTRSSTASRCHVARDRHDSPGAPSAHCLASRSTTHPVSSPLILKQIGFCWPQKPPPRILRGLISMGQNSVVRNSPGNAMRQDTRAELARAQSPAPHAAGGRTTTAFDPYSYASTLRAARMPFAPLTLNEAGSRPVGCEDCGPHHRLFSPSGSPSVSAGDR